MDITIKSSSIKGELTIPPSKSEMQRVIAAALLADGETTILNPSFCEDAKVAIKIAEQLGAKIIYDHNKIRVSGGINSTSNEFNFGESALALRMFAPIIGLTGEKHFLTGNKTLISRPINTLTDNLSKFGIDSSFNQNSLPLSISGKLVANRAKIIGNESSQVLTGLLMALPCVSRNSVIYVENLKSKPYISLTISVLNKFGIDIESNTDFSEFKVKGNQNYIPQNYTIEGDWSNASFIIVAASIAGNVSINGLNNNSKQSDIQLLNVLKQVGVNHRWNNEKLEIQKSKLAPFEFDATDCPDLFPPLVALASYCMGTSKIKGVSRLKHKESNRGIALKEEFTKLGIKIEIFDDLMLVVGGMVHGGKVDSHHDHRMAMALAVAALGANNEVIIQNAECVSKSYPDFFRDLKGLQK